MDRENWFEPGDRDDTADRDVLRCGYTAMSWKYGHRDGMMTGFNTMGATREYRAAGSDPSDDAE